MFNVLNLEEKSVTFNLFFGPIMNFVRNKLPEGNRWAERGNCARWTSSGLVFCGVLSYLHIWPKSIWVHLYEKHGLNDRKNVNVVVYEHIQHAKQTCSNGPPLWIESVKPFNPFYSWNYWNLTKFADVVVKVPDDGSYKAIIEKPPKDNTKLEPNFWRWKKSEMLMSCLVSGFALRWGYKKWGFNLKRF